MQAAADPADLFDLGNSLLALGQTMPAIEAFRRCALLVPDHPAVRYNLGNAWFSANRPVEAAEEFLTSLRLAPDLAPAYVNLAHALRRLTLLDQARQMAEQGLQLLPEAPEARISLANVLHDMGDYEAAALLYRQVADDAPDHAAALSNLGNSLCAMGEMAYGLTAHDQAVAAAPEEPEFHFNRATALLAAGDFAEGWEEYEWRWRRGRLPLRFSTPPWSGEAIAGRTLLLHAEQGLGDTLQFVRYTPMAAALGARVILEVQPSLVSLLRCLPGVADVIARGDPLPDFDVHCPLLSLPRAFGTRLETIPAPVPYLAADPGSAAAWNARLPADGWRVGLVWAGSPHTDDAGAHLIDRRRSLDPEALGPLAAIPGVHLISLQKDRRDNGTAPPMIDPMPEIGDFAGTAAVTACLDLVIAVDTSVAHLAGALGRPVWLLSRYDGCWRWLRGTDSSPWYPGLRLYRQTRPHDWSGVIDRVAADMRDMARLPPPRRCGALP